MIVPGKGIDVARKVEVLPYNPSWQALYRAEALRLRPTLGENLVGLHHMGSTAVLGLAAKPTIDILMVVRSHVDLDSKTEAIEALGYQAKGENGISGRRYFQRLDGEVHLFHLHAYQEGHPDIRRHLNFRDYLRAHPETAQAYADLKRTLAAQFTWEPKCYTQGKTDFILAVDRRAAAWRQSLDGSTGSNT